MVQFLVNYLMYCIIIYVRCKYILSLILLSDEIGNPGLRAELVPTSDMERPETGVQITERYN